MSLGHGAKKSIVAHGGTPSAIYSLRQLYKYSGPILKIRRSSDDTTQDFYFSNTQYGIPEDDILTFVGSNDGFVETWYDQSGRGAHATRSTLSEQPKIVSSGVIEKNNNRPTITFSGAQRLLTSQSLTCGASFGVFDRSSNQQVVAQRTNSAAYRAMFAGVADDLYWTHEAYAKDGGSLVDRTTTSAPLNYANIGLFQATGVGTPDSQSTIVAPFFLGYGNPSYDWLTGSISEIVVFESDVRSKRTYIENDQMEYYNI